MSDFLTSLAERSLEPSREVQPQVLALFASGAEESGMSEVTFEREREVEPPFAPMGAPATATNEGRDFLAEWEKLRALFAAQPTPSLGAYPLNPQVGMSMSQLVTVEREAVAAPRPAPASGPALFQTAEPRAAFRDEGRSHAAEIQTREIPDMDGGNAVPEAARIKSETPSASLSIPRIYPQPPAGPAALVPPKRGAVLHPEPPATEAQTIQITIGRLEIRAAAPAPNASGRNRAPSPSPMALEEYLRQRASGGAR